MPELVAPYAKQFLDLLENKNNRLQWGAIAVLDNITGESPEFIYENLPSIIFAIEKGSVITKDRGMAILLKLCALKKYTEQAHELFLEQLLKSLPNQLPMYAEQATKILGKNYQSRFISI